MKKRTARRAVALMLSALMLSTALPLPAVAAGEQEPAHDGYIVKLKEGFEPVEMLSEEGVAQGGTDFVVVDRLEDIEELPAEAVEYVEPNYLVELFDTSAGEPDDPLYKEYQWNLRSIHMSSAYRAGLTGRGVKVGFVDSGLRTTHEDLRGASIRGTNMLGDQDSSDITDTFGHGTFAAGIVMAQTDNGVGLAGAAPGAEYYGYRVFSDKISSIDAVVRGMEQAVADGCRVINMSLGTAQKSKKLEEAVNAALEQGCIVIAAVGNDGNTRINYPAGFDGVIGVGAVDPNLVVSSFSNRNSSVDIVAPGSDLTGLSQSSDSGYDLPTASDHNRGTSFSAPHVAALAALALEYDSALTADSFLRLLTDTAVDLGKPGRDDNYGYGAMDVERFLAALERPQKLTYEMNGAPLPQGLPGEYHIRDGAIPLPTPVWAGHVFCGWYEKPDFSGEPIYEIPAGAGGDLTLYAGWQVEGAIRPRSITVQGYEARQQDDGSYLALLPYGTDLSALNRSSVNVVYGDTLTKAAVASGRVPGTLLIRTETKAPVLTGEFLLRIACSELHAAEGALRQTGTAVPAAMDGTEEAVPYTVDAARWFRMGAGDTLPGDFTVTAQLVSGRGELYCRGSRLTYIPSPEDRGCTVLIYVRGKSGGVETPEFITLSIAVEQGKNTDGSTTKVTTDPATGRMTVAVTLPAGLCEKAEREGNSILLSMPPWAAGTELRIHADSQRPVRVTIPLEQAQLGMTALLHPEQGEPELVRKSAVDGTGLRLSVTGDAVLTLTDRSRTFPDTDNHWASNAVKFVTGRELFAGVTENSFGPAVKMSRGMLAQVLYTMEGRPAYQSGDSFTDVKENDWFRDAVLWASGTGVASGYGNGQFGPEDNLTREQLALILYSCAGRPAHSDTPPVFTDSGSISGYAVDALAWAVESGIMNGVGGGRIAPQAVATRAEAAVMLMQFCGTIA